MPAIITKLGRTSRPSASPKTNTNTAEHLERTHKMALQELRDRVQEAKHAAQKVFEIQHCLFAGREAMPDTVVDVAALRADTAAKDVCNMLQHNFETLAVLGNIAATCHRVETKKGGVS